MGITLALQDVQARPGGEREAERIWAGQFGEFLPALDGDDFIGVQNYSRVLVGPDGMISAAATDAEVTQLGYEFYPGTGNVSSSDNFEWMLGYRPTFGLIAVDRATQRRTVKDSARYLGGIARRNALT